MSAAARKPSIRDYDRDRMQRIALAMWGSLLVELKDEQGVVFLSSVEVLDAMAMLGGVVLSSWPDAKVPSRLRERCQEQAKNLAERTRQCMDNPETANLFDAVLTEPPEAAH